MKPRIEVITEKMLIGKRLNMTFSNNRTFELWHSFMPARKLIKNTLNQELISLQIYDQVRELKDFTPDAPFEKWAAVEVSGFDDIPAGMETLVLPGGTYAVFLYKGTPEMFRDTFLYIFGTWLPASGYLLDDRPHFEILGEKYIRNHPDSEEEVWIPIKNKQTR
ncbi:MAG: GyrI-like domain-containing protein [Bacteroidota bacterium]